MRSIKTALTLFVAASMLIGCAGWTPPSSATATDLALCETWGRELFLPSRADTQETAERLMAQVADYEAACPGWPVPQ